jgi:hypothetical protein
MSYMFRPILAAAAIAFALPAFAQTAPATSPATTDATPSTMSAPAAAPTAKTQESKAPETKTPASAAKSSSVATKDKVALAGKTESKRHHHHKVTEGKQLAKNEAKPAATGSEKTPVTK